MKPLFAATLFLTLGLMASPALAQSPGLSAIGADPASLARVGIRNIDGTGIRIGQIEFGNPLTTHPALAGHVTVVNNPARPAAITTMHGTMVAGVMVDQDAGNRGVAPGAQDFSFALGSDPGASDSARRVLAGDTLLTQGVQIVNESNSTPGGAVANGRSRQTLAVDWFADQRNLIWVQTPGNLNPEGNRPGTIRPPGDCFNCITVGATGPSPAFNQVAAFSPQGRTVDLRNKPDIVAPGTDIRMPTTPAGFGTDSGTSFAAPMVSGVAALLDQFAIANRATMPNGSDHRVIKAILMNSASKDGGEKPGEIRVTEKGGQLWSPTTPGNDALDDQMGSGELNAQAAFVQFNRPEATNRSPAPGTSINFSVDPIAWDFNRVYGGQYNQYNIDQTLKGGTKLTATIDWDEVVTRTPCVAPCNSAADDTFTAAPLTNLYLDLYRNGVQLQQLDVQGRASYSHDITGTVQEIYFTLPSDGDYSVRVSDISNTDALFGFAVWSHAVPEPSTWAMMLVGFAGLGFVGYRRRGALVHA
jgi:Subtilase family/PEP-CTERM motif